MLMRITYLSFDAAKVLLFLICCTLCLLNLFLKKVNAFSVVLTAVPMIVDNLIINYTEISVVSSSCFPLNFFHVA